MAADGYDDVLAAQLQGLAGDAQLLKRVFDSLSDCIFYIKDAQARYLLVNDVLIARSGLDQRNTIGKTSDQLFFTKGQGANAQALAVIRSRVPIINRLRLYWSPLGIQYWCLSSIFPIIDASGSATGLIGVSKDLPRADERQHGYHRLLDFSNYVERHLSQKVLITKAAEHASISVDTLERYTKEVFHLTPKQLVMKMRIDRACSLLENTAKSITAIATECGYSDHSAFSRQFKSATNVTPRKFREARPSIAALSL
jgi:AraC-like DNA-binding protein